MYVIKIGGSLQHARGLAEFLGGLAEHAAGRVVVVPGGGDYADQVRQMQVEKNLDEVAAHRLALRAMEQYGSFLVSLDARLQPASSWGEIDRLCAQKKIPVWFPYEIVAEDPAVEACWDVTSDSLAIWCAEQLRCRHLFLLKAVTPAGDDYSASFLSGRGYLDKGFMKMAARTSVLAWWLDYQQAPSLLNMLASRDYPATVMHAIGIMTPH